MKLAIRKEQSQFPGNYHYFLHPIPMTHDTEAELYRIMGYKIIDVENEVGKRLTDQAVQALRHQVEIAILVENRK